MAASTDCSPYVAVTVRPGSMTGMRRVLAVLAVLALVVMIRVAWGSRDGVSAPPVIDPGPVESPQMPAAAFSASVVRAVGRDTFLARNGRGPAVRAPVIGYHRPHESQSTTAV